MPFCEYYAGKRVIRVLIFKIGRANFVSWVIRIFKRVGGAVSMHLWFKPSFSRLSLLATKFAATDNYAKLWFQIWSKIYWSSIWSILIILIYAKLIFIFKALYLPSMKVKSVGTIIKQMELEYVLIDWPGLKYRGFELYIVIVRLTIDWKTLNSIY